MPSSTLGTANNRPHFLYKNSMTYLEKISDANSLFDAFRMAKKGSDWKTSVQRFEANLLRNIYALRKSLRDGTYRQKPFYEFIICERGKIRPIRSQPIEDRVIQRSLCDNALLPVLRPYFIYDNGASLQGKGITFSRNRIKAHLEKFIRKYGDGYILLIDFSKFFDNIPHDKLLNSIMEKFGDDKSLYGLIAHVLETFRPDVSYMTDDEYSNANTIPFNSMVHRKRTSEYTGKKGLRFLNKSMAIGSQISQVAGVFFPTAIDNYFKNVCGFKYYGRYMDDVYIIHQDKQILVDALNKFMRQAENLDMFVNTKKTQIIKLSHGFTYLQTRYKVTDGRIKYAGSNKTFVRERRRLKKFRVLLDNGRLTRKMIRDMYLSWRGNVLRNANRAQNLRYTDALYMKLFLYG